MTDSILWPASFCSSNFNDIQTRFITGPMSKPSCNNSIVYAGDSGLINLATGIPNVLHYKYPDSPGQFIYYKIENSFRANCMQSVATFKQPDANPYPPFSGKIYALFSGLLWSHLNNLNFLLPVRIVCKC